MVTKTTQDLDPKSAELLQQLVQLQTSLRAATKKHYQRLNPFCEDLFNWQERGHFWTQNDTVTIYNSTTIVGQVKIGNHTWIGPYCALDGTGGLSIGQYCSVAQGCQLFSHDSIKWALSGGKQNYDYAATTIGDNCFLGAYVIILKGVTVGRCCVIAAGAIVSKDVPDFTIVAGVPAVPIGEVEILADGEVKLNYFKIDK